MWSNGIVDLPFKVIGTKNKNIPIRLHAKNFILMIVYYIIFFYFLQILSGILFKNLWYNWSVFKNKRGV